MRRNYQFEHIYPTPEEAQFASVEDAFIAALKPMVKLWTRDEQSQNVLRLDEEPVQDKDKVA